MTAAQITSCSHLNSFNSIFGNVPWQNLLYPFRIGMIGSWSRAQQEQDVSVWIQPICFSSLNDTVHDCACLCAFGSVAEQEILSAHDKRLYASLSAIGRHFQSPVQEDIVDILLLIFQICQSIPKFGFWQHILHICPQIKLVQKRLDLFLNACSFAHLDPDPSAPCL